jgi:hypothetical protein
MTEQAPAIFIALEGSAFAAAVRSSSWMYMAANVGHIVSLMIFFGAMAVMDLRMAGVFAATSPASILRGGTIVAVAGFIGLALTGFTLFAAEASHVALNPVFQIKVALIVLGGINVAWFEFWVSRRVQQTPPLTPLPPEARFAGISSLAIWLLVAICGRSIAYF